MAVHRRGLDQAVNLRKPGTEIIGGAVEKISQRL